MKLNVTAKSLGDSDEKESEIANVNMTDDGCVDERMGVSVNESAIVNRRVNDVADCCSHIVHCDHIEAIDCVIENVIVTNFANMSIFSVDGAAIGDGRLIVTETETVNESVTEIEIELRELKWLRRRWREMDHIAPASLAYLRWLHGWYDNYLANVNVSANVNAMMRVSVRMKTRLGVRRVESVDVRPLTRSIVWYGMLWYDISIVLVLFACQCVDCLLEYCECGCGCG